LVATQKKLRRDASAQRAVLDYLAGQDSPVVVADITAALPDMNYRSIADALKLLVKRGAITRVSRGRYTISASDPVTTGDLNLLRILSRAVLLAKEHEDTAALDELRRDLGIALRQPDRSALWYHGIAALIDHLSSV
jgi:predicted transcriptional regulator of viral defense system